MKQTPDLVRNEKQTKTIFLSVYGYEMYISFFFISFCSSVMELSDLNNKMRKLQEEKQSQGETGLVTINSEWINYH